MRNISRKILLVMSLLSLAMCVGLPAGAAADKQDSLKACNSAADNKGLKGEERKTFMQDCMSKGNQPLNDMNQRDKMNVCKNLADKKKLAGEERRSFLKDCMNKANPR